MSHGPPCTAGPDGGPCVRCAGFAPENAVAERHGATSPRRVSPRAQEWLARLEAAMRAEGVYSVLDDFARHRLAWTLARAERYQEWLDENDAWLGERGEPSPAATDLVKQDRLIVRQFSELGLSLRSREHLRLVAAQAEQMVKLTEVQDVIVKVMRTAGAYVLRERRAEFLRDLEAATGGLFALDPGDVVDAEVVGDDGESS